MKIKFIIEIIIKGGLVSSLSAPIIAYSLSVIFLTEITWDFLLLAYLIPALIYFSDFLFDKKDRDCSRNESFSLNKNTIIYSALLLIVFLISSYLVIVFGNLFSLIVFSVMVILGLLYSSVFKKLSQYLVGFKDYYVALCWNLIIVLYLTYYSVPFELPILLFMSFVFIRDFVNISFCDIKDIEIDKKSGYLTFARVLGKNNLLGLLQILNALSIILLVLFVMINILPMVSLVLSLPVIITSYLIHTSNKTHNFSTTLVDFEYIMWFVCILIVRGI